MAAQYRTNRQANKGERSAPSMATDHSASCFVQILDGVHPRTAGRRPRRPARSGNPRSPRRRAGGLRLRRGAGGAARAALAAVEVAAATALAAAEHDQLANVDLGAVARLVLPCPATGGTRCALRRRACRPSSRTSRRCRRAASPWCSRRRSGATPSFPASIPPRRSTTAGGERERGDAVAAGGRAHLGIVPEISDQRDFVQASAHEFLLARE